ncbi:hypothetical protein [Amycolatopsis sp. NPDC059657]|uniref:hypothetical protein n=1 Tax=Amycolatopsis sp. NPDC059657 TaxID=3346899 RepID=UPI00366D91F9
MGARTTKAQITAGMLCVATTALVTVTACSSGDDQTSRAATTTPLATSATTPSPASPADQAKQKALAAYTGMWRDFVAAGATSDWQSPELGRHATGIALTNMSRGLYADRYNGLVTKGEPTMSPNVTSAEPALDPLKIIVTDCGDSTKWLKYRADNGQLSDDKPGGRRLINAIVEKQADGSWKVSDFGVHDVGTC